MRTLIFPLSVVIAFGIVMGTASASEKKADKKEETTARATEKTSEEKPEETTTGIPWQSSLAESWTRAGKENRPILLYFTTKNCYYCAKMLNETLTEKSIVAKIRQDYIPVNVNGTLSPKLVQQLKIRAYPTTVIITPDAKMKARLVGYIGVAELEAELEKVTPKVASTSGETTTR